MYRKKENVQFKSVNQLPLKSVQKHEHELYRQIDRQTEIETRFFFGFSAALNVDEKLPHSNHCTGKTLILLRKITLLVLSNNFELHGVFLSSKSSPPARLGRVHSPSLKFKVKPLLNVTEY